MSFYQEASFDEGEDMAIKAPVGKTEIGRTCTESMEIGNSDDHPQFLSVRSKGPGKQIEIYVNDSEQNLSVQQEERDGWGSGMPNPFGAQNKADTVVNTSLLGEGRNSEKYKTQAPYTPIVFSSTSGIKTLQPRQDKNLYSEYPLPLKKRGHLFENAPYSRKTSHDEKIKNDIRNLNTGTDDQNHMSYPLEELYQLMEPILRYAVQKGTCISINNKPHRITATPVLSPDTNTEELLCGTVNRRPPDVQDLPMLISSSVSADQYCNHCDMERENGYPEVEKEMIDADRSEEPRNAETNDKPLDLSLSGIHKSKGKDTANADENVESVVDVGESQIHLISKEKAMESVNTVHIQENKEKGNEGQELSHRYERSTDNFLRILEALQHLPTHRVFAREAEIEATKVDRAITAHQQVEGKPDNCSTEERTILPDLNSLDLTDRDGCVKETAQETLKIKLKRKIEQRK